MLSLAPGPTHLPSVFQRADYREEWRSLKELDQMSPYGPDDWKAPSELQEVQFQGTTGIGLLRAFENKSESLSFAFRKVWESPILLATHLTVDESDDVFSMDIDVPNLAKPEHVTIHKELIRELGIDQSSSSINSTAKVKISCSGCTLTTITLPTFTLWRKTTPQRRSPALRSRPWTR